MPQTLLHQGKNPHYLLDRRWGGSRASLDVVVKRKISAPAGN